MHVHDVVMSMTFWNVVKDCIRASHTFLFVLTLVDGDECPAMPQLVTAMDNVQEEPQLKVLKKAAIVGEVDADLKETLG